MKFLYLWPLVFLFVVPVIIIMYMLKQRAKDQPFSSIFLWHELYANHEADTPWEKLKKNILLFLQLLALLFLILALCSPYLLSGGKQAENVIVIIDNSGSMNALYQGEKTRIDEAKEQAASLVNALRSESTVTLITCAGDDPTLVVSNTRDHASVVKQIKDLKGSCSTGKVDRAVAMALTMQKQLTEGACETYLFTDQPVALGDLNGQVVNLITGLDNGYVDYISYAKSSDGGLTVMAKITNAGPDEIVSDVNLYIDDNMIGVKNLTIPSGESKIAYFDGIYVTGSVLKAELNRKDDLMEDNVSYEIIKTGEEEAHVLLVTRQNLYLEKAMAQIPNVQVTKTSEILKIGEFENENYDLYIFDGMVPDGEYNTLPKTGNILIFNGVYPPYFNGKTFSEGLRVTAEQNSVMKYIENASFGVGRGYIYEVPEFADSFLTTAEGCVGFIGLHDTQTIAAVGFDVHDSDLPLLVEFPIMIHNLLNETIITGMVSSTKIDCGEGVRVSSKLDGEDVVVHYPDATESLLMNGSAVFDATDQVGVYHVSQKYSGGELKADFAVNFPNEESENVLREGAEEAENGDEETESNTVSAPLNLRNWILLLVLIILVIEWIVYVKKS